MFVECCCFSKFRYRATLGATAALALIATGAILYSAFDLQFSRLGTLFIVTNTVLVVAETLYNADAYRTQGASRTHMHSPAALSPRPSSLYSGTSVGCSSTTPTPSISRSKR